MPGMKGVIPAEARASFYTKFFQVKDADKPAWLLANQKELIQIAQLNALTPFNLFFPLFFQCKLKEVRFGLAQSGWLFVTSIDDFSKLAESFDGDDLLLFLQTCDPAREFLNAQSRKVAIDFLMSLFEGLKTVEQIFSCAKLFFNWVKKPNDLAHLKTVMFMNLVQKTNLFDEHFIQAQEAALEKDFLAYQENKVDSTSPVFLIRSKSKPDTPSNNGIFAKKSKKHEKSSPNRERKHRHSHKNKV